MKILAINGSPHKEGNTFHAIKLVTDELENEGIETEIVQVGNKIIRGCAACYRCTKNRDEKCVLPDDNVNEWIQKMKNADGIIIGSPVHYAAISATLKSFLDRAFYVSGGNSGMFRHKVGAGLVAVRRSGGMPAFNELNNYLNYSEMVIATSNYWNVIHGATPGQVLQDAEGVQIMKTLGRNMAWIMKVIENSKEGIKTPERERKVHTNFVR